jgi:hypothetical protein
VPELLTVVGGEYGSLEAVFAEGLGALLRFRLRP